MRNVIDFQREAAVCSASVESNVCSKYGFVLVMKKFSIVILSVGLLLILYACPKNNECTNWSGHPNCTYEYPINVKNLKDTIKTTDTLWVENDLDAYFCLDYAVKGGIGEQQPYFRKLTNDTFVTYVPIVTNYTEKIYGIYGEQICHSISFREQDDKYQSKYGIVFSDTGIYSIITNGRLTGESCRATLLGYFNTPSNNSYLLPEKLQKQQTDVIPYHYRTYFIAVVE